MSATTELAKRQQQLVQLIYSVSDADVLGRDQRLQQGLTLYQHNLRLSAQRALSITYPVIHKMIGPQALGALASHLLQRHPPHSGDWGQWGQQLPQLITQSPLYQAHPYLSAMAELEWKLHLSAREKLHAFDHSTLPLLAHSDLSQVQIELAPTLHWQRNEFPLHGLWQAHQDNHFDGGRLADAIQQHNDDEYLLIQQHQLRAQPQQIDAQSHAWLEDIKQGLDLSKLMQRHHQLDFPHWLRQAITNQWIIQLKLKRTQP